MQLQAKAARQLVTSIGSAMPSVLQLGGGARAGSSAAAGGDDDDDGNDDDGDDDDVGGGGDPKAAKNKRRQLQQRANSHDDRKGAKQAAGDSGYSRRGRATSHATPGDFEDFVQFMGDVVPFTWPSRDDKPECVRSFDAGAVKADSSNPASRTPTRSACRSS